MIFHMSGLISIMLYGCAHGTRFLLLAKHVATVRSHAQHTLARLDEWKECFCKSVLRTTVRNTAQGHVRGHRLTKSVQAGVIADGHYIIGPCNRFAQNFLRTSTSTPPFRGRSMGGARIDQRSWQVFRANSIFMTAVLPWLFESLWLDLLAFSVFFL